MPTFSGEDESGDALGRVTNGGHLVNSDAGAGSRGARGLRENIFKQGQMVERRPPLVEQPPCAQEKGLVHEPGAVAHKC